MCVCFIGFHGDEEDALHSVDVCSLSEKVAEEKGRVFLSQTHTQSAVAE